MTYTSVSKYKPALCKGAEVGELETCKTIGEERKFLFAIVNNDSDNAVAVGGADAEYPS